MGSEGADDSSSRRKEEEAQPPETEQSDMKTEKTLLERRYTKPCARFLNGVRVGFGFVFERTCRPWTCQRDCGATDNLLHRHCRFFEFKPHQAVVLRQAKALKAEEEKVGHPVDSYEGFRSDWIHFSVSVVAPLNAADPSPNLNAEQHNGFHFSPKASAHFLAWWRLFNHTMSLPIRQGSLFPHAPPPSKKFGRSLGTIKYRFDLAPVYLSHMYTQVDKDLWVQGKAPILGIKARIDHIRADAHQRAQEKFVNHEKLGRSSVIVHKPFYAGDVLVEGVQLKGVRAIFRAAEAYGSPENVEPPLPKVSELPETRRVWYNFLDFIDCNRKPIDHDPEIEFVDFMDCPTAFYSMRNKAELPDPHSNWDKEKSSGKHAIEKSKFGHEKSHICYLGAVKKVSEAQMDITQSRVDELEAHRAAMDNLTPVSLIG